VLGEGAPGWVLWSEIAPRLNRLQATPATAVLWRTNDIDNAAAASAAPPTPLRGMSITEVALGEVR